MHKWLMSVNAIGLALEQEHTLKMAPLLATVLTDMNPPDAALGRNRFEFLRPGGLIV